MERDQWALFALLGPHRLPLDLFRAHDPPFMAFLDPLELSDLYPTLLAGPYHLEAKEGHDQEQLEGLVLKAVMGDLCHLEARGDHGLGVLKGLLLVAVKEVREFKGAKVNPLQLEVRAVLGLVGVKEVP